MDRQIAVSRNMYRRLVVGFAAVFLALVLGVPARAGAVEGPGKFLIELTDRAISQLTEPGLTDDEQERRFRRLLKEGFDLQEIGRFVLGRYWRGASEAQRSGFLVVFEDLMVHRFLPLFAEFSGEKFDVGASRPFGNNPNFVSVASRLLRSEGEPIRVDWRMRERDGAYKIVDIVAEGISMAVTLRSEYVSVLKQNRGDIGALIGSLRAKIAGL